MALVAYSDSEDSDSEVAQASVPTKTPTKTTDKPTFQKFANPAEPRKIRVDLPSVRPEPREKQDEQPRAKRPRTGGAFSGFNNLLPAPKRAAQTVPKPGVSLKTSSEAAFSRVPVEVANDEEGTHSNGLSGGVAGLEDVPALNREQPKIVGKATKFKPLSVGNKKKPVKKVKSVEEAVGDIKELKQDVIAHYATERKEQVTDDVPSVPKPKRPLFSVPQADVEAHTQHYSKVYESITTDTDLEGPSDPVPSRQPTTSNIPKLASNPDSLQSLASDLNLTPAQRRQLFGRNAKDGDVNIAHFNMDSEYAANEQLRQAGEVVEHRAVKSIAPGKHSLQQLVNNARSQREGLEDKWAEGRRDRGEGGARYGWGR